jgi:hypothetical protein
VRQDRIDDGAQGAEFADKRLPILKALQVA